MEETNLRSTLFNGLQELLEIAAAPFVKIDGHIFIDIFDDGSLPKRIASNASLRDAQKWVNIVVLRDTLEKIVGIEWELDDAHIRRFIELLVCIWQRQVQLQFPDDRLTFTVWSEEDTGDVGVIVVQHHDDLTAMA